MQHTEFAIDMLLERLQTRALQDRTPKKYAGPMFEAWETIQQYRSEISALKAENETLKAQVSASSADSSPMNEPIQESSIAPEVEAWIRLMNPAVPIKDSLADRSCPNCDAYISWDALNDPIRDAPHHCKNCGQAFDWSKEPKYNDLLI